MIIRRQNSNPFNRLRDEMEGLFNNVMTNMPALPFVGGGTAPFPALNLWEDEQNIYVEAEVPGLTMQSVEVFVVGNELSIRGERREPEMENAAFHRRERGVGAFSRVIRLPSDIDSEKVQATLRDGVLTITLPKAEAAKPRKIEVRS